MSAVARQSMTSAASLIQDAGRALVLGIGGGGDVVGSLAVARFCESLGTDFVLGGVAWAGCGGDGDDSSSIEQNINEGVEEAQDAVEEGIDEAEDSIADTNGETQEQLEQAGEDAGEGLENGKDEAQKGIEEGQAEVEKGVEDAEK